MIFPTLRLVTAILAVAGLTLSWAGPLLAAKIYQYTNSEGETVFTDEPTEGATVHEVESAPVMPMKPVETPEVLTADDLHRPEAAEKRGQQSARESGAGRQAVPEPPAGQQAAESAARSDEPSREEPSKEEASQPGQDYDHFEVVDPVDGEVASRLKDAITVELAIQPGLRDGDRVRILVDGDAHVKDSSGRRHLVNGLSPGKHEITAQIRRDDEVIRESRPVRFTLVTPDQ
ncbi:MAG: DUF4124 domain-containing protein [Guyparkeria sp.]